jgi:probable 2-oxoglutarate dehydrogenase E1 component DHKTD1
LQLTNDRYEYDSAEPHANVNMHVAFPTTPAQYFHLLRRQVVRNFRKPLIVAAPKGLLRLPVSDTALEPRDLVLSLCQAATSSLAELGQGTMFQPVLDDSVAEPSTVERVVLLSGKLYYDLVKERSVRGLDSKVALIRVEELCPFPFEAVRSTISRYAGAREVFWVQEEPRNQGSYTHIAPRVSSVLEAAGLPGLKYKGRKEDAVPAPGCGKVYQAEQKQVLSYAFDGL